MKVVDQEHVRVVILMNYLSLESLQNTAATVLMGIAKRNQITPILLSPHCVCVHLTASPGLWVEASGRGRHSFSPESCTSSSGASHLTWTCLKHLPREVSRRHTDQVKNPPQLSPLDMEELNFSTLAVHKITCIRPTLEVRLTPKDPPQQTAGALYATPRIFKR